jgi:hypothetical protein
MSYELTGKTLRLAFDGSGELILKIKDQTSLELINLSETPCTAPYICMKADDSVYLLFISPEERCMIFVLDAGQNLVTCVTLYQSGDKRAEAEFKFGTIAREEAGHTEKKHGFSDNLWGNGCAGHSAEIFPSYIATNPAESAGLPLKTGRLRLWMRTP